MSRIKPEIKAKEVFNEYNSDGLVPFPFDAILEHEKELEIRYVTDIGQDISGAILYSKESEKYIILININKTQTRQYFTVAHELGHYFLHSDLIKEQKGFIDNEGNLDSSAVLFREDNAKSNEIESEANRFAATLIMPEALVRKAWAELGNVDKCAEVFGVSVLAMSIRLDKLGVSK